MMEGKEKDFVEVPMSLLRALLNVGKKEPVIEIPESVIENLLTLEGMKNHSAVESVCNMIRQIAEDQCPDRFRSDRHGTR